MAAPSPVPSSGSSYGPSVGQDLLRRPVDQLLVSLEAGETTSEAIVEAALQRVARTNPALGHWLRVDAEGALAAARDVDRRRAAGEPVGPLGGLPVGIKDQLVTRGLETTAASRILEGFVPPYDATAVARVRAADGVVLGKVNQDEFAFGSSNETSAFFPARNPWDPSRVPGGSSGGAAAAVAAGTCALSLGTDTGGSVRQPASFCGVVGLRPTYGRVSRYGLIAHASSLDQVGVLGRTVHGVALGLQAVAGRDPRDATSLPAPVPDYRAALADPVTLAGRRPLRVGYVPAHLDAEGVSPAVASALRASLRALQEAGATLVQVALPHAGLALPTYYVLATSEAASNLARFDGVRYGHRAQGGGGFAAQVARTRTEGFGDEVKRRILLGTFVLSGLGSDDGTCQRRCDQARRVRALIRRDYDGLFSDGVDVVATPTAPTAAFPLGARVDDTLAMYAADALTVPASLAGLPALSLPMGFSAPTDPTGPTNPADPTAPARPQEPLATRQGAALPLGLQLVGPPLSEGLLLTVGALHEGLMEATEAPSWARPLPALEAP